MSDPGEAGEVGARLTGPWHWQPDVVAILVVAALCYSAVWVRQRARTGAPPAGWRHLVAWLAGLAVVAVALLSPLGTLDDELFWVHMVQHELFIFAAPPLFLVGAVPFLKRNAADRRTRPGLVSRLIRALSGPLIALGCSAAILWLWHVPRVYELALACEHVHRLEHLSFLGAYILYWRPLMRPAGPFPVLRTGTSRTLYILAGGTQCAVLSALIAFADTPFYHHYVTTADAWGLTALADQRLGGAIMLFSGAVVSVAAAALTIRDVPPCSLLS